MPNDSVARGSAPDSAFQSAGLSRAGRWLRTAAKLIVVALAVLLAARLLRRMEWAELGRRVASAQPGLLGLAVAALVARPLLMYSRWARALRLLSLPIAPVFGFSALLAGVLANHLTPTARLLGGVVRARLLARRYAVSFAGVYGTVLLDQVSNQLAQGAITWLVLAVLARQLGFNAVALGLAASFLVLVAVARLWRRRQGGAQGSLSGLVIRKLERQARRVGPALAGGREIVGLFRKGFSDHRLQGRMAAYGAAILLANAAGQWWVLASLGSSIDFSTVFLAVTVGLGAGVVTGTPGGFATTEAALIAVFVASGVPEIDAAAGTLVFRGLHYLLVVGLGLPALIYCELSLHRRG